MTARLTLCIGAAHWDLIGRTARPLAAGTDVPGKVTRRPGGVAQNIARTLAALGQPTALLSAVGRDPEGDVLVAGLAAAGVDVRWLHRTAAPTDTYVAIEAADGTLHAAVADCAGLERAGTAVIAAVRDGRLAGPSRPWQGGAVIDGNLPLEVARTLLAELAGPVALVPASPAKAASLAGLLDARPVTVYLNRAEAEALCGIAFATSRDAAVAVVRRGAAEAVVTDGAAAATAASAQGLVSYAPPAVAARSVTGAGDRFVAAHLAARAHGCGESEALAAAVAAAVRHITSEVP